MSLLSDVRYQCVSFALSEADGDEREAIKLAIDSYEDDIGRCDSVRILKKAAHAAFLLPELM